jgi:hypothetical protein
MRMRSPNEGLDRYRRYVLKGNLGSIAPERAGLTTNRAHTRPIRCGRRRPLFAAKFPRNLNSLGKRLTYCTHFNTYYSNTRLTLVNTIHHRTTEPEMGDRVQPAFSVIR